MTAGLHRFARYAAPPNARQYCGPDDEIGLALQSQAADDDLRSLAREFDGAWPYLELIAACLGLDDPLDDRAVAAYWEGSSVTELVPGDVLDSMTRQVHGPRVSSTAPLSMAARLAVPHHSYHVYCVYPWAGLLRQGIADPSVQIMDKCRISVGRVASLEPLLVDRRSLEATDGVLAEGPFELIPVSPPVDPAMTPALGDLVSLHWDSICAELDGSQADRIRSLDARHREIANQVTAEVRAHKTTA